MRTHNWDRAAANPGGRWATRLYWPVACGEVPRLGDGSVDVRGLCGQWDDAFNEGCSTAPNPIPDPGAGDA